jgi:hypothetical protein
VSRRNLVPMPTRRAAKAENAVNPAPPLKTWHSFAFLIVNAIVYNYAGMLILVIAASVVFFKASFWLCVRFPRTISAILAGLLSSGRRRW